MLRSLVCILADASGAGMDNVDWAILVIAILAIPVSLWANIRWWRSRAGEQRRDWQSFWMVVIGLVCMVAIVVYYLVKFIIPNRT
jgi:hypothetical protein